MRQYPGPRGARLPVTEPWKFVPSGRIESGRNIPPWPDNAAAAEDSRYDNRKEIRVTISLHATAIETFVPMLNDLSQLLDKGALHAKAKGLDPKVLVEARLAPDMYPLARQVQLACDNAKSVTARLAAPDAPRHQDNEKTIHHLHAPIPKTIPY